MFDISDTSNSASIADMLIHVRSTDRWIVNCKQYVSSVVFVY